MIFFIYFLHNSKSVQLLSKPFKTFENSQISKKIMASNTINNPIVDMMVLKLPLEIIRAHGGSESLADKINALIYESTNTPHDQVTETPKKRGRPTGSKNKSKDVAPTTQVTETPKKRGRPTGSKNKSKDVAPTTQVTDTPKKRGRPAGSKNKPKDVAPATQVTDTPKKRGRPAGSKNKPKDVAPATQVTDTPKKRSPDKHTRKSKRSMAAAITIQRYARRYINEYHVLLTLHSAK